MKDLIKERLKILANAQYSLADISIRLDRMEKSVEAMENCSYELLNKSDKLLAMSKLAMLLTDRLKELFASVRLEPLADKDTLVGIINDIHSCLQSIHNTCMESNCSSHEIESEAVIQRENKEFINDTLTMISNSISSAVACAEMLLAQY